MRLTRMVAAGIGIVTAVVLAPPAEAAAPAGGGCAAFGANVADLATTLGPVFGATASGVATSGPAAFPTNVVGPEQAALCTGNGAHAAGPEPSTTPTHTTVGDRSRRTQKTPSSATRLS